MCALREPAAKNDCGMNLKIGMLCTGPAYDHIEDNTIEIIVYEISWKLLCAYWCIDLDADKLVVNSDLSESSLDGMPIKTEVKEDCEKFECKPKTDNDCDKLDTVLNSVTDGGADCCPVKNEPADVVSDDPADVKSAVSTDTDKTVVKVDEVKLESENNCLKCCDTNDNSNQSLTEVGAVLDSSAMGKYNKETVDAITETDLSSKQDISSTEACLENCTQTGQYCTVVWIIIWSW